MRNYTILFITILFVLMSCTNSAPNKAKDEQATLSDRDKEAIMTTFIETQDAWNDGNIEEFMKGYWESDKLVFTGAGGVTYGYDATLNRYIASYPDNDAMGILKFTVKDLYQIDLSTALMIGQFYLSREMGDLVGHYTLVWQKIDDKWLIISDHSSGQNVN